MKFHKLSLKVVSKCNEPRTVPKKNKEGQMAYKTELCNIRRDRLMETFLNGDEAQTHATTDLPPHMPPITREK